jgi:hypothetical protein
VKVTLVNTDTWSPPLKFSVESFPAIIGCNGTSDLKILDRRHRDRHCELNVVDGDLRYAICVPNMAPWSEANQSS